MVVVDGYRYRVQWTTQKRLMVVVPCPPHNSGQLDGEEAKDEHLEKTDGDEVAPAATVVVSAL